MYWFSITLYWLFCYGQNTTKKKHLDLYYISKNNSTSSFRAVEDVANIAIEKPNTLRYKKQLII
jgi:hypothetical protein